MISVLFVCVYNACRSQIAEAICRRHAPRSWIIASVGRTPSDRVDVKAAAVLQAHGLHVGSPNPKGLRDLPARQWDWVVGIGCRDVRSLAPARRHIVWDIPDPQDGPIELYHALYQELERRILALMKTIEPEHQR